MNLHLKEKSAKIYSMSDSAMAGRRASHRQRDRRRINTCAQPLAEEHGLDGFTMDDLADAAGVSRRTLFNYFPGKDAAVLGDPLGPGPGSWSSRFVAGGPTGHLVDDIVALIARPSAARASTATTSPGRRLLAAEPRLMAAAHERFGDIGRAVRRAARAREGADHDAGPAPGSSILVLAVLFDISLTSSSPTTPRPARALRRRHPAGATAFA